MDAPIKGNRGAVLDDELQLKIIIYIQETPINNRQLNFGHVYSEEGPERSYEYFDDEGAFRENNETDNESSMLVNFAQSNVRLR